MVNTLRRHIAASGARKGQWVNCSARERCTLQNTTHISEQQLFATSAWLRSTGNKKTLKTITETDVSNYFKLDDANSPKWNEQARLLAVKTKGIPDPHGKANPFTDEIRMPEIVVKSAVRDVNALQKERDERLEKVYYGEENFLDRFDREQRETKERKERQERYERENKSSRPQPRTFARTQPSSPPRLVVFRGETVVTLAQFKNMEMEALKTGGILAYDSATISTYDNGTPARVSIKNLGFSGNTQFTSHVHVTKQDAEDTKRNSRAITVRMFEKDYNNFLEDAKNSNGVELYVHKKEVTRGFFRSTVTATIDVRSKSPDAANRIYDYVKANNALRELTSLEENFTQPSGTEEYKGMTLDADTQDTVKKVYQKIGSVESTYDGGQPLSMSDAHYLQSAQTKYIPDVIDMYSKFSAIKDPATKLKAKELFVEQLNIIYKKIDKIGKQREASALNAMRGNASFLADRSDSYADQTF